MSMEPSLLLLVLCSGVELRRGVEMSDGATASHHHRRRVSPSLIHMTISCGPPVVHSMSSETLPCCRRLRRVVNQGEA
ncbi:hypothetical protein F2Q69_00023471 [Brassica cretica]|uniref:Secreted protein n=1 Tax=Brassica cretica TaxID=69181 RepID=A0A8S9Q0X3_BRACR|nr:hypothetical protein F2Q69_00023471 [Brassica cretica]